jgi:Putative peptidoglycan binding domain
MRNLIFCAVFLAVAVTKNFGADDGTANKTPAPQPQKNRPAAKGTQVHVAHKRQAVGNVPDSRIGWQTGVNPSAVKKPNRNNNRPSYAEALRRYKHERHDCNWWRQHYTVIVFVNSGYYYWDAGYWCPAWGYDPVYDYYDYDGPIYTYGNLLPDQVILNVQGALQSLGYYSGKLTGSLNLASRQALASYQEDAGLAVTGAIDAATVEALGLVGE